MTSRRKLLAEVFAVLERWMLMVLVSFWSLIGIGDFRMLLKGNQSVSMVNVSLCLSESLLGLLLMKRVFERKNAVIFRVGIVVVAVVIFWFQPNPWMHLNDYPLVLHGSFSDEFARQRIIQAAVFACFALPFILIEFLPLRTWQFRDRPAKSMSHRSLIETYLLSAAPIGGLVWVKGVGGTSHELASHFIVVILIAVTVLLELARRSVRFNYHSLLPLIIVAIGAPILLLLLP